MQYSMAVVFRIMLFVTQIELLSAAYSGGETAKIVRTHVGRVWSLLNHKNVIFGQETLNELQGMSWCIVMMQLPRSCVVKSSVKMKCTEPVLIPTTSTSSWMVI
jgi:hypothetical protein